MIGREDIELNPNALVFESGSIGGEARNRRGVGGQPRYIITLKEVVEPVKTRIYDASSGNFASVDASGRLNVVAVTAPASGVATDVRIQDSFANKISATAGNLHIDVQTSVLPTGAATAALQTTGNAILTTIDTDTGVIAGDTTSIDAWQASAVGLLTTMDADTSNINIRTSAAATSVASIDGKTVMVDTSAVSVVYLAPDGTNTMPAMDDPARAGFVQITDGTNSTVAVIDPTTFGLVTVDHETYEINNGDHYYIKNWIDMDGAGDQANFVFVTPNTTVWAHPSWEIAGEDEFTVTLYEGATVGSTGSVITPTNSNRNYGASATVSVYASAVVSSVGTEIWAGKVGAARTIGSIGLGQEIVGKQNTTYIFNVDKANAGTHWLGYYFKWYEHADLA